MIVYYSDSSVREKDWRKRGMQATSVRRGDLAGVTRAWQHPSFERMHTLCLHVLYKYRYSVIAQKRKLRVRTKAYPSNY